MSKSVLISIQPKWCELIANGKKLVEVRKTKPKIDVPFKCYIYATQPKKWFRFSSFGYASDESLWLSNDKVKMCDGFEYWADETEYCCLNGKVIGEFVCDQIDEIGYSPEMHGKYISDIDDIHYVSCVDFEEMFDYLADGYGYGWHISDLVIYDKPKELGEFKPYNRKCYHSDLGLAIPKCKDCHDCCVERPPQSWCYVEEAENE